MSFVVDSQNIVSSLDTSPDKLRAEIGSYYTAIRSRSQFVNYNSSIKNHHIISLGVNNQQLIPTKKYRIFVSGRDRNFRDQVQWGEYITDIIKEGGSFLDHQFYLENFEVNNSFHKIYHNPGYEDITKTYQSNQLLNYNLISYDFKHRKESVGNIADIRTSFDNEDYLVNNLASLTRLMNEFENRLVEYTGSSSEIINKQRNIFCLNGEGSLVSTEFFPYYYEKSLPTTNSQDFSQIINRYGKTKNILKSIKNNSFFFNRQFGVGDGAVNAELHNFMNLIASENIIHCIESNNELFLLPEAELQDGTLRNRFVDQINAVKFLSEIRAYISNNSRTLEQILNSECSNSFVIGYKIEKFLDNDATQPIQTYYTTSDKLYDTQLKYGRKYIYKTKALIGVLGSSYTYSNLYYSKNQSEMQNSGGQIAQTSPAGMDNISAEKFRAYVDVEVIPSFQILEYQIDVDEVAFIDSPMLPPHVEFFNKPNQKMLGFFLSPTFARIESVTDDTGEELVRNLVPLVDTDVRISNLLSFSKDTSVRSDYFTGIYEVYRMSTPPQSEKHFSQNFLTRIDDKSSLFFPDSMGLSPEEFDNMNGIFEDFVQSNKKYYYAFRALTYHGTPSNLTIPLEIELIKDSDEYKIVAKEYQYPIEEGQELQKMAKRIVKLTPNVERLFFTDSNKESYKLDDGSMLEKDQTTKFKIRITSKHTGKKIDINLNLILQEDINTFST